MHQVTINGQSHPFPEGLTINQALGRIGLAVPTLCNDDRIAPYGSCRLCTVEVKGMGGLATACNTQLRDGMEILTHSPAVTGVRKMPCSGCSPPIIRPRPSPNSPKRNSTAISASTA